ncbi:YaaC family protein [Metabacillus sp. Hm71]|uniref:YaaC family protein n=1 Tax=Metabacillus sp. Hm71 TaxID=3450743 RepID=UPI003F41CBC9
MTSSFWERLLSYHSTETVQKKLEKCYKKLSFENASGLSYENGYRFVYFLKHGENFFLQAGQSPYTIQPMLLFYGISQLIKACLIVIDPEYPSTSSVLAHGVSSRKRKKQQYHFLKDEIKIQRNGLFSHVANKLFQINHLDAEKYSMELLLKQIAEMNEVFFFHHSKEHFIKLKTNQGRLVLSENIAQCFHMSLTRLAEYLEEKYKFNTAESGHNDCLLLNKVSIANFHCAPFSYHLEEDCFYLPNSRETLLILPELLVHYLLLYNLSMISRYETEWWYELLLGASSDDYPFILRYIEIAKRKIPYFVLNFLEHNL